MKLVRLGEDQSLLTGKIIMRNHIIQPFMPLYFKLISVSIPFGNYCRTNNSKIFFSVLNNRMETVKTIEKDASMFKDNEYVRFELDIEIDKFKIHYLKIDSDALMHNAVTSKWSFIKDRKIALQGIEPAKKVEVDVNHTITDAREKLTESYDRYFKMKQNAIDVTPSVDKAE